MPIFSYGCKNCGFQKDALKKAEDTASFPCPACLSGQMVRQLSAPGIIEHANPSCPAGEARGSGCAGCPLSNPFGS